MTQPASDLMRELGLQPISFDPPAPDAKCPGKVRLSERKTFGLCHTCARFGGHDIEPAARMACGMAVCPNFMETT